MTNDRWSRRQILRTSGTALAAGGFAGCMGDTGSGGDANDSNGGGSGSSGNESGDDKNNGNGNDPTTIRYSYVTGSELIDNISMFHQSEFMRKNVLKNFGNTYKMELKKAQGTPVVVSTLGAKEADAGILAYSSLANATINNTIPSGGRVVAPFKWQTDRTPDGVYALAESDIGTGQDLKGKSIAVPAIGSASDLGARAALVSIGLDPQKDVELREISFGAMPAALKENRVQAAGMIQPFIYMMGDKIKRLFPPTAGVGQHLVVFATIRNQFANQNPEAIHGLLEDLWLGLQWWTAKENREKAIDIATKVVGLDRSTMEALIQTNSGYYQGNNGLKIGISCLQNPFDMMNDIKFIDQKLSANEFIDNSFLPKKANTISVKCG